MPYPEPEILSQLVARVFHIDDVTLGEPARGLVARYRGHFLGDDTAAAYDQLAESLGAYEITPLFRKDGDLPVIYLVPRKPEPKPTRVSVNILLFVLTVLSVMLVGAQPSGAPPADPAGQLWFMAKAMLTGWPYAAALMSILLAHEFGHYLMSSAPQDACHASILHPAPASAPGNDGRGHRDASHAEEQAGAVRHRCGRPDRWTGRGHTHPVPGSFHVSPGFDPRHGWHGANGGQLHHLPGSQVPNIREIAARARGSWRCLTAPVLAALLFHRPAHSAWSNRRLHPSRGLRRLGRACSSPR